jgi:hypothetical protein
LVGIPTRSTYWQLYIQVVRIDGEGLYPIIKYAYIFGNKKELWRRRNWFENRHKEIPIGEITIMY